VIISIIPGVKDTKARPAVVLADLGDDDLIVAPITKMGPRSAYDIPIAGWRNVGLQMPCYARANEPPDNPKGKCELKKGGLVRDYTDLDHLTREVEKHLLSTVRELVVRRGIGPEAGSSSAQEPIVGRRERLEGMRR